jgi:serine/threonine protein phosphatase PrpC
MTLSGGFLTAGGSVTGREHRRAERDGQDGFALVAREHLLAAVVTDGCSSGQKSEIGARIGAAWLAALIEQHFAGAPSEDAARAALTTVSAALLARLELLARSLDARGDVRPARVEEALLFTYLAAVVTPSAAVVFGIGDGVVLVDGALEVIDPGPDNAPPYVAYGLFGPRIEPRVHFLGPTAGLERVAIATDGLQAEPALPELTSDPRYAQNPSLLRKRLVVLADQGRLSDDATVAVIARRAGAR